MTKKEMELLIPHIKAEFIKLIPESKKIIEETPVYLITDYNRKGQRKEVFDKYDITYRADGDMCGEAVFGTKGRAVLIYTVTMDSRKEFCRTVWHELGHIFTNMTDQEIFLEAENDKNAEHDTLIRNGMAIWAEFIAEALAIRIEDDEPQAIAWPMQDKLKDLITKAVYAEGHLMPYPLAFYCALMMEDNTITCMLQRTPDAAIGLDHCDDTLAELIIELLQILDKQLCKEDYWSISRETLEIIGNQVNKLWDHCYCMPTPPEVLKELCKRR